MTALPRSIKRQLEEANAYMEAQNAAKEAPAEPENEPQEEASVEPEAPRAKAQEDDAAKWEQRYRTLQGEFNAKVPVLQKQLKEQLETNESLNARLLELERNKPVPKLVTSADEDEFGADMLDLIDRKAREIVLERERELQSKVSLLESKLQQAEGNLNRVSEYQVASSQERMVSELTQLVPNWEEINRDPGFLAWLGEEDPTSGIVRQQLLDDAASNLKAARVANIFKAFVGGSTPTKKQDALSSHAAPTRNANAVPKVENTKGRIYSVQEVEAFYDNAYRKNLYSAEKRAELEAELNLAISENRVR